MEYGRSTIVFMTLFKATDCGKAIHYTLPVVVVACNSPGFRCKVLGAGVWSYQEVYLNSEMIFSFTSLTVSLKKYPYVLPISTIIILSDYKWNLTNFLPSNLELHSICFICNNCQTHFIFALIYAKLSTLIFGKTKNAFLKLTSEQYRLVTYFCGK